MFFICPIALPVNFQNSFFLILKSLFICPYSSSVYILYLSIFFICPIQIQMVYFHNSALKQSQTVSHLVRGGVQQSWYMHTVVEFNSLELGTCMQWGSSNLLHAAVGECMEWGLNLVHVYECMQWESSTVSNLVHVVYQECPLCRVHWLLHNVAC